MRTANHAGQFRLFMPEEMRTGLRVKIVGGKALDLITPLAEVEKPAVRDLRNLLLDKAQFYCERMRKELDNPLVKELVRQSGIRVELLIWPNEENWNWPTKDMHEKLQARINGVLNTLQGWETKKAACLRWANYDRWAIAKLGRLDELLRTGNLDEFFKRYQNERGIFAVKKRLKKNKEISQNEEMGRTLLAPHWPIQTHEFRALKNEWKKENVAMEEQTIH